MALARPESHGFRGFSEAMAFAFALAASGQVLRRRSKCQALQRAGCPSAATTTLASQIALDDRIRCTVITLVDASPRTRPARFRPCSSADP